jgi:hypothetical protein
VSEKIAIRNAKLKEHADSKIKNPAVQAPKTSSFADIIKSKITRSHESNTDEFGSDDDIDTYLRR